MPSDKLYTPEEVELNKFYLRGNSTAVMILERTGKKYESYPGTFSNIYKTKNIYFGFCTVGVYSTVEETKINPEFRCFSKIDVEDILEFISEKQAEIELLKEILK